MERNKSIVVYQYTGPGKMKVVNYQSIYRVLETILAIEIILLVFGSVTIFNLSPIELRVFYWTIVPWSIVITAPLWFVVRHKVKSAEPA